MLDSPARDENSMPGTDSQEPERADLEKLFEDFRPLIPGVVRSACTSLNHHPQPMFFDGYVQRVAVALIENDFHTLRTFDGKSEPETWLFTIARRTILLLLDKKKRWVSLDGMPPDALVFWPDLDEHLLFEEREQILRAVVSKLTKRERELLELWRQGLDMDELAETMGITKRSVATKKNTVKRKLKQFIQMEQAALTASEKR